MTKITLHLKGTQETIVYDNYASAETNAHRIEDALKRDTPYFSISDSENGKDKITVIEPKNILYYVIEDD